MLEALLAKQREGVLQRRLPPPVLAEVVSEERCHLGVLLGSTHKQQTLSLRLCVT